MAFLNWDPSKLSTGVKSMDDEHIVLIDMMNKLYDVTKQKVSRSETLRVVDELFKYTVKHFGDEERYMESVSFPGLGTHKLIHKSLLERLTGFKKGYEESGAQNLPDDFFVFLKMWLTAHIQGIDFKYAQHAGKKAS